jgi:hypothetical protein
LFSWPEEAGARSASSSQSLSRVAMGSTVNRLYVSDHPESATPTAENEGVTRLAVCSLVDQGLDSDVCAVPEKGNVLSDQIVSLPALDKDGEEPILFRRIEYPPCRSR